MIVLKISNASEVVASKVGKFIELLTPDSIDHTTVEVLWVELNHRPRRYECRALTD